MVVVLGRLALGRSYRRLGWALLENRAGDVIDGVIDGVIDDVIDGVIDDVIDDAIDDAIAIARHRRRPVSHFGLGHRALARWQSACAAATSAP